LRKKRPEPKVEIYPETAEKYGINEGETVIIKTIHGEIRQTACITDTVEPRVINASNGWWFPEKGADSVYGWKKSNFNILTSTAKLGKEFRTPNLKGIPCRIIFSPG